MSLNPLVGNYFPIIDTIGINTVSCIGRLHGTRRNLLMSEVERNE